MDHALLLLFPCKSRLLRPFHVVSVVRSSVSGTVQALPAVIIGAPPSAAPKEQSVTIMNAHHLQATTRSVARLINHIIILPIIEYCLLITVV